MEIVKVAPTMHRFKDCSCSECNYRFSCWTSNSDSCPLKMVFVEKELFGDNHLMMKFSGVRVMIKHSGEGSDGVLLSKIGDDLTRTYYEKLVAHYET